MITDKRIALLVDGENLSADHAQFVLETAGREGPVNIRRVYGNAKHTAAWATIPGFRIMHTPSGKNIADIALSLDALEFALTGLADTFYLATSDRDFVLVATRLRELGHRVVALGEPAKVAAQFRLACHEFVAVPTGNAAAAAAGQMKPAPAPSSKQPAATHKAPFEGRLKDFLLKEGAGSDGWVQFNRLGQASAKAAGISKAAAGIGKSASWIDWFARHRDEYEIEKRGTESRARLLRR